MTLTGESRKVYLSHFGSSIQLDCQKHETGKCYSIKFFVLILYSWILFFPISTCVVLFFPFFLSALFFSMHAIEVIFRPTFVEFCMKTSYFVYLFCTLSPSPYSQGNFKCPDVGTDPRFSISQIIIMIHCYLLFS